MKPSESFVPLTAAPVPPAPREFRVAVLSAHDHANGNSNGNGNGDTAARKSGFQSLDSQRSSAFTNVGSAEKRIGEPRVTLQRDGDHVTHLRIQCGCGQVIDLACVYDAPAAAPEK